jgi:transcriptional regulator with XRE-family HTH domain
MNELAEVLAKEFKDKEYAHAYIQSHLIDKIAAQVHTLRLQREKRQDDIELASGIPQARLSKIESADFDSLTLKTLFKLAQAYDVALDVRFQSFGDAIKDVVNLSKEGLKVPSRTHDLAARADVREFVNNPLLKASKDRMVAGVFPVKVGGMERRDGLVKIEESKQASPA